MAKSSVANESPSKTANTASRRSRQPQRRGRSIVALLLVGFVLVASAVIWRRSYGVSLAEQLADLHRQQTQLEGERIHMRGLIRDESSRSHLGPVAEKLGMHVPSDRQVRFIRR